LTVPVRSACNQLHAVGLDRVLIMQNGDPAKAMLIHKASGKTMPGNG
jgi:hypothetical protein